MFAQRALAAGVILGLALVLVSGEQAQSRPRHRKDPRMFGDVDATSSVVLDRLSVKSLGVDRPWDPRICIGCDPRGESPHRPGFGRSR